MKSPLRRRSDPVETNRSPTGSLHSSPRRQQALSPRDPSGKRVTQHGARLIVDEVASLTTMAEAAAAAEAAKRRAGNNGGGGMVSSPPRSPRSPGPASPHDRVTSADTLDGLIQQVDNREDDKYRSVVAAVLSPNDDTVILSDPSSATGTQMTLSSQFDDDDEDDDEEEEQGEYEFDYEEMNNDVRITMDATLQQVRSLSPCSPTPNNNNNNNNLTTSPPFLNKHHQTSQSSASMESSKLSKQKQRQKQSSSGAATAAASGQRHPSSTTSRHSMHSSRGDVPSSSIMKQQYPYSRGDIVPVSTLPMVHRNNTLNTMDSGATNDVYHIFSDDEGDYWKTKQKVPYLTLIITALQVLVLMLQLTLCGVAPLTINPMVGPFPDAFSEWGGKNPYLMMIRHQYWRFVSPAALHVGVLHLLLNAYCQLETCAFFEREWASFRWFLIYLFSEVGCILVSSVNQPDTFAVGSTGAIMGLLGAKLAQALSHIMFDIQKTEYQIRLEQMSNVLCSLSLLSLLSFVTYIDWSGHVGGLATGFLLGMVLFCKPIEDVPSRVVWCFMGLAGLGLGGYVFGRMLWEQQDMLDAELADPCNYFRRLFPEGYDCECLWGA